MKTGSHVDGIQTQAKIVKDATGVARIIEMGGCRKLRTAGTMAAIAAQKQPTITAKTKASKTFPKDVATVDQKRDVWAKEQSVSRTLNGEGNRSGLLIRTQQSCHSMSHAAAAMHKVEMELSFLAFVVEC